MKKIVIAIDGFSSTGKSSMAKALAQRLHYTYVDSGAMYRAITLYFLNHNIDLEHGDEVCKALSEISLSFKENKICLNGVCAEPAIREMRVSDQVSQVSALEQVRHFAVKQQQALGQEKGIVMDGRDIGTAVFPDAELKIYLFASAEIRAKRRFDELAIQGQEVTLDAVTKNLQQRDFIDSTREISPLRKASDAVELDNSHLSFSDTLEAAYNLALKVIHS